MATKRRTQINLEPTTQLSRDDDEYEPPLDESEQEAMIHQLEKQAIFQHRIYRAVFSVPGLLLAVLYFYFSYVGEDFGENLSKRKTQFSHFIAAIGFILSCCRSLFARKHRPLLLTYQQVEEKRLSESLDTSIEEDPHGYSWLFIFALVCNLSEVILFANPIINNIKNGAYIGYNTQLFIFSRFVCIYFMILTIFGSVPLLYLICVEYAIYVMESSEKSIKGLYSYMYKHKVV